MSFLQTNQTRELITCMYPTNDNISFNGGKPQKVLEKNAEKYMWKFVKRQIYPFVKTIFLT